MKKKWASPYDGWEDEMFRKAPIRRHLKTLPKTERLAALMETVAADEQHFTALPAPQDEKKALQLKIAEALDNYQGNDGDMIREQVHEKIKAKEFTPEFAERILATLRGE